MKTTARYLNDEHMRLYEWNGLRSATALAPEATKRSHAWHASYGVLAILATMLLLNGCDRTDTAQSPADPVDQTAQAPGDRPLYDEAPGYSSGDAGAPSAPASEPMSQTAPAEGETGSPAGGTTQP